MMRTDSEIGERKEKRKRKCEREKKRCEIEDRTIEG